LINWLKKILRRLFGLPVIQQGENYLLRLPGNEYVWLTADQYIRFCKGHHAIIWQNDGSVRVETAAMADLIAEFDQGWNSPYRQAVYRYDTIAELVTSTHLSFDTIMPPIRNRRLMEARQTQRKRELANPDHLPYDPRYGF